MSKGFPHIMVNTGTTWRIPTAVEQIYISLLKHGDEAEMRNSSQENAVRIHFIDPDYGMDGFTLTLEPFNE